MHRYERYDESPVLGRLGTSLRVQLGVYRRRPRRDGGPERRFVVFAQGRSGSTLLAQLLASHPDVHCDHEILSVPVFRPLHFVERTARVSPARAHGFRVKVYQLTSVQRMRRPRDFVAALHEQGVRIVHLRRENLLRQAVSNLYALAHRTYHYRRSDEHAGRPGPIAVDPKRVIEMMEKRTRYADDEERALAGLPAHRLLYERDLLAPEAWQETASGVFRFLGLDPAEVEADLVRSVRGGLEESVSNLPELERALRDTRYAAFLDDPRYA